MYKDFQVAKDHQELQVLKEIKEIQGHLDLMVVMDKMVHKDQRYC